ncbi:MAG: CBS domain-containing protein [Pseudomonadota bacterium]
MKSLKVRDHMATRLITVQPHTNVVEAMGLLLENGISGVPVVNDNAQLVGVLSEVDAMQAVMQDSYYDESVGIVADVMTSPAETVDPNEDIYSVAERFIAERRRRYPVVNESGALVGQISRRDALRAAHSFLMHTDKVEVEGA